MSNPSTPCLQFQFRAGGRSDYQGERVVPFDGKRHAPWEMLELRREQPVTMANGWFKGLLMQERLDAQAAKRRRKGPSLSDLERKSRKTFRDALDWALQVGFSEQEAPLAASAAVMLKGQKQGALVTKMMVLERCRTQWPEAFA